MGPPNKQLIKKKVNPRKTTTNKQSGIDGPSKTVKKYDASDFSTNKKAKDMLAIKANPKVKKSVKNMKNTFADDTTAKRKLKNTFADDTTAKRTPKKDTSDFAASSNKNKKKINTSTTKTGSPKTFGEAFAQARKKQGAGGTFTYKGKKYSTNRADDKKKTKVVKKKKTSNFLKTVKSAANQSRFKKSGSFKGVRT